MRTEGQFVHVLNRGVDKRKIFLDKQDYLRFIHDLYEFNDEEGVSANFYHFHQSHDIACREIERKKRTLLVFIHAFSLMQNHYHLLLSETMEGGITKFMKKLDIGYAKYFNARYQQKGALFEGRFKHIPITNEKHLLHLPFYIHFNPLDALMPEWRHRKIDNAKKAIEFLEQYRWSSFQDYIGKKNFPSVTQREFLSELLGNPEEQRKEALRWLKESEIFRDMKELSLEE